MGYYTKYSLRMPYSHDKSADENLIKKLHESCNDSQYALLSNGEYYDAVKWYNHETDMCAFSEQYPDVLFELDGVGEEEGDIWRKYFKNGKVQRIGGRIVFDVFDPDKLGSPMK